MMTEVPSASSPLNQNDEAKIIPISTKYGYVIVTQQGPTNRPTIVTFHDVGYNSAAQFHQFFTFPDMAPITEHFTVYHINAPGQEERASPLPTASIYPTMDQLAETINDIFAQLNIKSAIGFGVGLGANVLVRFALKYPTKIYGLILLNCVTRGVGWLEGFSLKWPSKDIPDQQWTVSLLNYLLWYHLGSETQSSSPDLVHIVRRQLEENVNVKNVIKLLNSYFKRTAISIVRQEKLDKHNETTKTLQCQVLNITGSQSPHKNDVIETHDRCDPKISSYVEFSNCGGAILEEQPSRTAEAIRLFLQGLGYMSHLSIPRYSTSTRLAEQSAEFKRHYGVFSKVPRRLRSQLADGDFHSKHDDDEDEFEEEIQLDLDSSDN